MKKIFTTEEIVKEMFLLHVRKELKKLTDEKILQFSKFDDENNRANFLLRVDVKWDNAALEHYILNK